MATPNKAYASDGFLGGLQDLVGVREVEPEYQPAYSVGQEESLRLDPPDPGTNEGEDISSPIEDVRQWVESVKIPLGANRYGPANWWRYIVFVLRDVDAGRAGAVIISVGLVFMWWGVRKAVQVLLSSFRKGSLNL